MEFKILLHKAFVLCACMLVMATVDSMMLEDCRTDAYPPPESWHLKTEIVNLDHPAIHRWRDIVWKRRETLRMFVKVVKKAIPAGFSSTVFQQLENVAHRIPSPYKEEIIGISNTVNIPLGELLACNVFYELAESCTSILAEDKKGQVYHSRNLDFWYLEGSGVDNSLILKHLMHPLTFKAEFQSGGKTLYKTVQFAGAVGVFTGVSPGRFSFSLNSRSEEGTTLMTRLQTIFSDSSRDFASFLARDVLQKAKSFEEAKKMLSTEPLYSAIYFILGGAKPNQGTVITRSAGKNSLPSMSLNAETRFLVQTNSDHWDAPPHDDDRRTPAKVCLNRFIKSSSHKKSYTKLMYNVMATVPVRNKGTTYTAIMCAKTGQMEAYNTLCTTAACEST